MSFVQRLFTRCQAISGEAIKFAVIGGLAFVVNAVAFNALLGAHWASVRANVVSTVAAMVVAYLGNRYWVYSDRRDAAISKRWETILFVVVNLAAAFIQWACLYISHYWMGLTSQLADNVSSYCFGMVLGTVFRFWTYRTWVFPSNTEGEPVLSDDDALELEAATLATNERTHA